MSGEYRCLLQCKQINVENDGSIDCRINLILPLTSAFSPMGGTSYISLGMATDTDLLFEHHVILGISQKNKKTAAQVLLRWAIQRNTLPISKSSSLKRMQENRALFDFYLSKEEMLAIDGLNQNRRFNDPGDFCEPGMGTFCPIYE